MIESPCIALQDEQTVVSLTQGSPVLLIGFSFSSPSPGVHFYTVSRYRRASRSTIHLLQINLYSVALSVRKTTTLRQDQHHDGSSYLLIVLLFVVVLLASQPPYVRSRYVVSLSENMKSNLEIMTKMTTWTSCKVAIFDHLRDS